MAALADILSPVWTLSKNGNGQITEGLDAIRQCLDVIITTTKGSDPLRPEFGCDAMKYVDAPINQAAPLIVKALLDAITTWETRVTVNKITWTLNDTYNLVFHVGYSLTPDLADELTVMLNAGNIATTAVPSVLILKELIPENSDGCQYTISLTLNNVICYPLSPATGFDSMQDLYDWVVQNWSNYGNWYLTETAVVGSINPQYTSGRITMGLITGNTYKIPIYPLDIGNAYAVSVSVNGSTYGSAAPLYTGNDILSYVQGDTTLGALGAWSLQSTDGDYNNDYNSDFAKQYICLALITDDTVSIHISQEASA